MSTIGFVGLGAMGARIAGRLLASGNVVHGTNRTKSKADPLVERGARGLGYGKRDVIAGFDVLAQLAGWDRAPA